MDGIPLSLIPEAAANAMTTAHILGGCNMGKSVDDGVIGEGLGNDTNGLIGVGRVYWGEIHCRRTS